MKHLHPDLVYQALERALGGSPPRAAMKSGNGARGSRPSA